MPSWEEEIEFSEEERRFLRRYSGDDMQVSPDFTDRLLAKAGLSPLQPGELEALEKEFASAHITHFPAVRKQHNWRQWTLPAAAAAMIVLASLWILLGLPFPGVLAGERQFRLASKYERAGEYIKAEESYRKAAEQGHVLAQYNLAWMYDKGLGGKQDFPKAFDWYLKAAQQGHADAQFMTADMYESDLTGLPHDHVKAVDWYRKAAEQGHVLAQYNLADAYYHGVILAGTAATTKRDLPNYTEAEKWYRKAAEQGNVKAQRALAFLYYSGTPDISPNLAEAEKWYRKAAGQGDIYAMNAMGKMLLKRKGDEDEAIQWLVKASEKSSISSFTLGLVYYKGMGGVKKDHPKALQWLNKASDEGNTDAQVFLGGIYYTGYGDDKNLELAKELLLKAAPYSSAAQYFLATMYYYGYGVEKNYYNAFYFASRATDVIEAEDNLFSWSIDGKSIHEAATEFMHELMLLCKTDTDLVAKALPSIQNVTPIYDQLEIKSPRDFSVSMPHPG